MRAAIQRRNADAGRDIDASIRAFGPHAGQQRAFHIVADAGLNASGRRAGQVADFVAEFAFGGDDVERHAAAGKVGGEGGKGDVIALVKRAVGFAGISHIANMADETGGVFNGVAALWRERRVGSAAMHAADEDGSMLFQQSKQLEEDIYK